MKKKDSLYDQLMRDHKVAKSFNDEKEKFENDYLNAALESGLGKQLLALDKKELVKALLNACGRHEDMTIVVDRLVSSSKENLSRFKARLSEYKGSNRFVTWKYSQQFADEITDLLEDLKQGAATAREGLELLKLFFEADRYIIECCDDSSGNIGTIFTCDATELFEGYARRCENKEWVAEILLELILNNDYGLRDRLTDKINEFLPENSILYLVDELWKLHTKNKNKDRFSSTELRLLEEMAKGLKDPVLYEEVIIAQNSKNQDYDNFRLGKIWLECNNPTKAIEHFENINGNSNRYLGDLDGLLGKAYSQIGDTTKQKEIAWKMFKDYRSKEKLGCLIELEGSDKKEKILKDEIKLIHQEKKLNDQSIDFLLEMNLIEEAKQYLLVRKDDLDGDHYYSISDWANKFEKSGEYLVTALIYRALLNSILARGYSKAYHHGVDYLKKLEKLSSLIDDWGNVSRHEKYFNEVKDKHKRKSSFWARYRGERR